MGRPRKYLNKAEGYEAQNARRKAERQVALPEFTALDGEGMGDGPDHRYVLLSVGDQSIQDSSGLGLEDIFGFLWGCFLKNPRHAFVGFYLGYDFTQWLKLLPENRADILFHPERRSRTKTRNPVPFPVRYAGWEFDLLGMKRFKLRKEGASSWLYVCDSGPFFQASLMDTIVPSRWPEPIVSESEYALLQEGKARRSTAVLDDAMVAYNVLENDVLARLMGRVSSGLAAIGIHLKRNQWFGPGQAASAWLDHIKAPTTKDLANASCKQRGFLDAGRKSYFGGWFEITAHGKIPGISWEYDINSAYPHVASRLPCMLHGQWNTGSGVYRYVGDSDIVAVRATVRGSHRRLGSMLHRLDDGTILRPHVTSGWYWDHEIRASQRAGLIDEIEYHEWAAYIPCDCRPPLRGLAGLYDRRLAVGKNTPEGKGAKLIYNSVYGKHAQSVGNPKYGNPVVASLITSGCRTLILEAIGTHPDGADAVLMVATDGVYFRSPHPDLPISERIGDWDVTTKSNLTLFKPGIYWDDTARERIMAGKSASFKARGISAAQFSAEIMGIDDLFAGWAASYPGERDPDGTRAGWFPRVQFTTGFSMVTCMQALQRGRWDLAGTLGHAPTDTCDGCSGAHLTQDSDPIRKRHSGSYESGVYYSRPHADGGGQLESAPYTKLFGLEDPEEYGIHEDGYVLDTWKGMLHG